MDGKDFESAKKTLLDINEVVSKMDPAVRVATFDLLVSRYLSDASITPKLPVVKPKVGQKPEGQADTSDLAAFLGSLDTKKPSDAVMIMVAWLYSQYGAYPITAKDIKELADSCGIIVPARSDNTMRQAKADGKSLFVQQGKGWKLTVSGEVYLRETYQVTKGTKQLSKE